MIHAPNECDLVKKTTAKMQTNVFDFKSKCLKVLGGVVVFMPI